MKLPILLLLLLTGSCAMAQTYRLTGKVIDEKNGVIIEAGVMISQKDSVYSTVLTGKDGSFLFTNLNPGLYYLSILWPGYGHFIDSFQVSDKNIDRGSIQLFPAMHILKTM